MNRQESIERILASAPPMSPETARAVRALLAGYAARIREDAKLAESRERPA